MGKVGHPLCGKILSTGKPSTTRGNQITLNISKSLPWLVMYWTNTQGIQACVPTSTHFLPLSEGLSNRWTAKATFHNLQASPENQHQRTFVEQIHRSRPLQQGEVAFPALFSCSCLCSLWGWSDRVDTYNGASAHTAQHGVKKLSSVIFWCIYQIFWITNKVLELLPVAKQSPSLQRAEFCFLKYWGTPDGKVWGVTEGMHWSHSSPSC